VSELYSKHPAGLSADGSPRTTVRIASHLSDEDVAATLRLVSAATDEDGVSPLSEHVLLHLRYGGDHLAKSFLLKNGSELAGYAHLDPTDPVQGPSGELVVHPAHRRHGLGLELLGAVGAEAGGRLRLWAHGDLPGAARLAASADFERVRALWQLRRSLQTRIGRPQFADGVTVRTFVPGQDEDAWTELNRIAFRGHPEQGTWTRADLDLREREPWFDPDGFFLAERHGKLVGFHWTKIHGENDDSAAPKGETPLDPPDINGHHHQPIGEVYVVGVDPGERGSGLGRALTLAGLAYLRSRGLFQVMLYVDETNAAAIGMYEAIGFSHWGTDVMYAPRGTA
jgi:mycothiol synthase